MMQVRRFLIFPIFFGLAACSNSGGITQSIAPQTGTTPSTSKTMAEVTATMTIGGVTSTSSIDRRSPQFVSPSTNGVYAVVYAHSDTTHSNPLGSSATDVSSGSPACGGQTGTPRTCSVPIPAPVGADDFVFTAYDAAPVSGSFSSAHALASGTVSNQTIAANVSNAISVTLEGIVASFATSSTTSVVLNTVLNGTLNLSPKDADGNVISSDPFSVPINVTVTETPGSSGGVGHTVIKINGGSSATTGVLSEPTDTLQYFDDGGGGPGYSARIAATSGSASWSYTINVFSISSSSQYYTYTGSSALLFTAVGQSASIAIIENGNPTFTATPSNCAGISTVSAISNATFTVTSLGNGSCSINVSDGTQTIVLGVSVTTSGSTITIP